MSKFGLSKTKHKHYTAKQSMDVLRATLPELLISEVLKHRPRTPEERVYTQAGDTIFKTGMV